jgi:hypothetical protein
MRTDVVRVVESNRMRSGHVESIRGVLNSYIYNFIAEETVAKP